MTIDPGDYDPRELREVGFDGAEGGALAGRASVGGLSPGDAVRSSQRQTLLLIEDAHDDLSSPYLTGVPDTYRGELLVLEWLELLADEAGTSETIEALSYYASIGWITDDVESALREYLRGIDAVPENPSALSQDDHLTSLVYIARLDAMT